MKSKPLNFIRFVYSCTKILNDFPKNTLEELGLPCRQCSHQRIRHQRRRRRPTLWKIFFCIFGWTFPVFIWKDLVNLISWVITGATRHTDEPVGDAACHCCRPIQ